MKDKRTVRVEEKKEAETGAEDSGVNAEAEVDAEGEAEEVVVGVVEVEARC